ncbi:glucuronyl hydrolase [Pedobacter sp. BS3]|uniref:glycoside hydrolase family 88 protein n=1 Tax=Pedobacter sp. BS3 TaxID=2567937 RepID=UPI0011EF1FA7|nr:glycoside hydrolase family 88 protein [Pedobacter sp. BS3]TZF83181.1 glucuronyl hydrolase [Pedobacter sp. BS3]
MNIIKSTLLLLSLTILACKSKTDSEIRLEKSERQLTGLRTLSMKANNIPRSVDKNGAIRWIETPYDWTEGFWPGTCWMIYERTKDEKWKEAAITMQKIFKHHKNLTNDHDLGFIFNNSYGKAYRITGENEYKQVMIDAANSLITRFNKNVGCIQSWDVVGNWQAERGWKFPVIIDNMMNLELLFEVSNITGDSIYRNIAITHANTTMRNHFRPDGSSYHVLDYNPETGEVVSKVTAQGYADESAWSRGQAWGLYAYTMCYRYTKDKKYLDFAEKIANFILNHPNYPEDGVPYWDFNAPNIPNEPRDASSGAIIASALLELSNYTGNKYLHNATHILNSLSGDAYTAKPRENGNFILMHSVGSLPHGNEINVPLNYADYYYIEALTRLKEKGL